MKTIILLISFIFLLSCNEEEITKKTETPEIGKEFAGGMVFYLFKEGEIGFVKDEIHGLVLADTSLGMYIWGCQNAPLSQISEYGELNTLVITEYCPGENAGRIYENLVLNGYSDWWLPSFEEMKLITENVIINKSNYYWTSTKQTYANALAVKPINGDFISSSVNIKYNILPIRTF